MCASFLSNLSDSVHTSVIISSSSRISTISGSCSIAIGNHWAAGKVVRHLSVELVCGLRLGTTGITAAADTTAGVATDGTAGATGSVVGGFVAASLLRLGFGRFTDGY